MKAAYYEGNKRIRIGDCEPRPPGPDEVRLQVSYCGICGTDLHVFHGNMDHRVKMPQVIGHEMSGFIAETGDRVKGLQVGEAVVVRPLDACGNCPACKRIMAIIESRHLPCEVLKEGFCGSYESEIVNNRNRIYYSLTKTGNNAAFEKIKELEEFIKTIGIFLKPDLSANICMS